MGVGYQTKPQGKEQRGRITQTYPNLVVRINEQSDLKQNSNYVEDGTVPPWHANATWRAFDHKPRTRKSASDRERDQFVVEDSENATYVASPRNELYITPQVHKLKRVPQNSSLTRGPTKRWFGSSTIDSTRSRVACTNEAQAAGGNCPCCEGPPV